MHAAQEAARSGPDLQQGLERAGLDGARALAGREQVAVVLQRGRQEAARHLAWRGGHQRAQEPQRIRPARPARDALHPHAMHQLISALGAH